MAAIPQVQPSDPEDVVWALQTAETLWKRDERSDAIVWLRRAAQAAGEAEQDERALELSKIAADLSDELKAPPAAPASPDKSIEIDVVTDDVVEPAAPAPQQAAPSFPKPVPRTGGGPNKPPPLPPRKPPPPTGKKAAPPIPMDQVPPPPSGVPGSTPAPPPVAIAAPVAPVEPAPEAPAVAPPKITPEQPGPRRHDSGRFAVRPPTGSMPEIVAIPDVVPAVSESMPPAAMTDTEVTTAPHASEPAQRAAQPNVEIRRNPSMTDIDAMAGLPPMRAPEATPVPDSTPTPVPDGAPSEPIDVGEQPAPATPPPEAAAAQAEEAVSTPDEPMRESLTPRTELSIDSFDAFADLPDDQRETLQKSAFVMTLKEGAEIPSFALAIVLGGDVDVAAHGVDAPAVRLPTGHVLYGRGSIESDVPMRLLGTGTGTGTEVAVWSRDDVAPIMKGCPWVEDDLRAAADPVLAAVGVTIGAFGARLDPTLRGIVTARLAVHSLSAGDVLFPAGKIVPGLFVVGAGVIELVKDGAVMSKLGPGDFIFPGAVVGGGNKAPAEARASDSGALVLSCDRKAAQELLMTCPPLLEILASL